MGKLRDALAVGAVAAMAAGESPAAAQDVRIPGLLDPRGITVKVEGKLDEVKLAMERIGIRLIGNQLEIDPQPSEKTLPPSVFPQIIIDKDAVRRTSGEFNGVCFKGEVSITLRSNNPDGTAREALSFVVHQKGAKAEDEGELIGFRTSPLGKGLPRSAEFRYSTKEPQGFQIGECAIG